MNYSNFSIWIGCQEQKFQVQVRPSDEVYGMWEPVEVSLDLDAAMVLRQSFRYRELNTAELQRFGQMLYDALLPPGVVRDLYQDSRVLAFSRGHGLRMRLHITSPELDALPWELLHGKDEGGFLILDPRFSIARTPHVRGAKSPIKGDVPAFPLRIVGAFSSPTEMSRLDTAGEQAAIDSAIKKVGVNSGDIKREEMEVRDAVDTMPKDVKVVPVWLPSATLDDLVMNVPEAHIFHYGGHGTTGEYYEQLTSSLAAAQSERGVRAIGEVGQESIASQEPSYIFLEDAEHAGYPLPASKLALILRRSLVRVAVFMACDTALQSPTGESLPQFLMESGLSAVVAMQTTVMDNVAMKFGRHFYEALAAGLPIDDALSAARYITRVSFDDYYNDWATPVLYLAPDANGLIFPERTADPDLEAARQRQPIIYVVQQIGNVSGQVTGVQGFLRDMVEKAPETIRESLAEQVKQGIPSSPPRSTQEELEYNSETRSRSEPALPAKTSHTREEIEPSNQPQRPVVSDSAEAKATLPPMTYDDFELLATDTTVLKADGSKRIQFTVRVTGSPAGALVDGIACEYVAKEMRSRIGCWEKSKLDWKDVIEVGAWLGAIMFPDAVEDLLIRSLDIVEKDGKGLRLRLTLDGELNNVPWEYLLVNRAGGEATSSDFLALMPNVSIVRHQAAVLPPYEIKAVQPAQMVVALASPEGYPVLDLDQERQDIENALASTETIHAAFIEDATHDRLLPKDDVHLFHFAGHGDMDLQMGAEIRTYEGRGYLLLDDGFGDPAKMYADDLALRLRQAGTRVAVLGACRSGRRDDVNVWSSVAAALLKVDLGAVVGMQYTVRDSSAIVFAREFYRALAAGLPIDTAVTNGRLAMAYNDDVRGWGVPVLYLRTPDGIVFPEYAEDPTLAETREQLRITASQRIRELRGKAVVVSIGEMERGEIVGDQEIDRLTSGAEATVVEIDELSGGSVEAKQKAGDVEEDATLTAVKVKRLGQ